MSADRISYCPRCAKIAGREPDTNSLREYIGTAMQLDGRLKIEYECECHQCGWAWEYHKVIRVNLEEKDD